RRRSAGRRGGRLLRALSGTLPRPRAAAPSAPTAASAARAALARGRTLRRGFLLVLFARPVLAVAMLALPMLALPVLTAPRFLAGARMHGLERARRVFHPRLLDVGVHRMRGQ